MAREHPTTDPNGTTPGDEPYPPPPDGLIDELGHKFRHRRATPPGDGEWPDWTPRFVRARPESLGSSKTWWLRRRSGLRPAQRLELHVEREELLHELHDLDESMRDMAAARLGLLADLGLNRDRLWPRVPWCRGRRPPCPTGSPIPPAADGAVVVGGGCLRQACLQILDRHGELPLTEIHAWLHRYGYVVAGAHPVKALADALGHEHDSGRCRRVARGVYAPCAEGRPEPGGPTGPHASGDPSTIIDPLTDPPRRAGAPQRTTGEPEPGRPSHHTRSAAAPGPRGRAPTGTDRRGEPGSVGPDRWWLEGSEDTEVGPFAPIRVDDPDDPDDPDEPEVPVGAEVPGGSTGAGSPTGVRASEPDQPGRICGRSGEPVPPTGRRRSNDAVRGTQRDGATTGDGSGGPGPPGGRERAATETEEAPSPPDEGDSDPDPPGARCPQPP